jgi:hypothetical protein
MKIVDKIVRSRRRGIVIQVKDDGTVIVRAPLRTHNQAIQDTINKYRGWIIAKRKQAEERKKNAPAGTFSEGDLFYFLGKKYPLIFQQNLSADIVFDKAFYAAPAPPAFVKKRLEAWYRKAARKIITAKVGALAAAFELKHRAIKINSANQRWGSCTCKGTLNFPWRLVMCPEHILDYIVSHEMAHLKQMNHSERFWRAVEIMCPDYLQRKQWLADNAHLFSRF